MAYTLKDLLDGIDKVTKGLDNNKITVKMEMSGGTVDDTKKPSISLTTTSTENSVSHVLTIRPIRMLSSSYYDR